MDCSTAAGSNSPRNRMFGRSNRATRLIDAQPSKKGLQSGTNPNRIDKRYAITVATSGNSPASNGSGQSARSGLVEAPALICVTPMRAEVAAMKFRQLHVAPAATSVTSTHDGRDALDFHTRSQCEPVGAQRTARGVGARKV